MICDVKDTQDMSVAETTALLHESHAKLVAVLTAAFKVKLQQCSDKYLSGKVGRSHRSSRLS